MNALNKFLWKTHGAKSDSAMPLVTRCREVDVKHCYPMFGTDTHAWVNRFRRVLCDISFSRQADFVGTSNTYGLIRIALKELHRIEYLAVPLDKAPGFVVVSPHAFSAMEELGLHSKYYSQCPVQCVNFVSVSREYSKLAGEVAVFHGDRRLSSNICSSLGIGNLVTAVSISVKSHKPLGLQTLRTIHCGSNSAFAGLSTWLVKVLEPIA